MTSIIDRITAKFGTQAALAEAIGVDQSTIAHWKRRNDRVPSAHQGQILKAARARGIEVGPDDFFPDDLRAA